DSSHRNWNDSANLRDGGTMVRLKRVLSLLALVLFSAPVLATSISNGESGAGVRSKVNLIGTGYNVLDYGAKCDGTTDDAPAIQATINALPASGGIVLIPGLCKINNTITIGNGTSSVVSTTYGVRLIGAGQPIFG